MITRTFKVDLGDLLCGESSLRSAGKRNHVTVRREKKRALGGYIIYHLTGDKTNVDKTVKSEIRGGEEL